MRKIGLLLIPAGIFLGDGLVKRHMDRTRTEGEQELCCGDRIILQKYYNKGAALNVLEKDPKKMKVIHSVLLGIVSLIFAGKIYKKEGTAITAAYGMMLGGGLSNLYDRYKHGHVVDYFSLNVKNKEVKKIVFNLSDFMIFGGAVISVLCGLRDEFRKK